MAEHDVEEVWAQFWEPLCSEPGLIGATLDLDQIKRELYDYHRWMKIWSEVACQFSGGKLSKINYAPDVYLSAFEEYVDERVKEDVAEQLEYAQVEADEAYWQKGYDTGWADGNNAGIAAGLEEARSRI